MSTVDPPMQSALPANGLRSPQPNVDDDGEPIGPERWFDRSSITADVMVMLEGVSEQDWWKYAPEGRFCEYLDGVVYMPAAPTEEHQDNVGFWFCLLNIFTNERNLGLARLGPGVLALAPGRNPEPDVFVIPPDDTEGRPPALLVVEALSPSTRSHDQGRKKAAYQEAGIPEIVYLDLARRRVITHRRADDLYTTEVLERGIWRSSSLPGFWLNVEWLWQSSLPGALRCIQSILAGPPA